MMLSRVLAAATVLLASHAMAEPIVSNVTALQRTDGSKIVDITYDVSDGTAPLSISVAVSGDGGTTYALIPRPQFLTGSVGSNIDNGAGLSIQWDAGNDTPDLYWPDARILVTATETKATPAILSIYGSHLEGTVTQDPIQNILFSFDRPVAGFDLDDITVTNATKGKFTRLNAREYTLEVPCTGGIVYVGATYNGSTIYHSHFYQDTWTVMLPGNVPLELIRIPSGIFMMGSPVEELSRRTNETQHEVWISQDFYLSKTEVTQLQWSSLAPFPAAQTEVGAMKPVDFVSWNDAAGWLGMLQSYQAGKGAFTLPTEAQWEYACRAGTTTRFSFGDGLAVDELCSLGSDRENFMWFCGNSNNDTQTVRQKLPNAWGLYDMHGNMYEWTNDWYGLYDTPAQSIDPTGPATGTFRVRRGGAADSGARNCRAAGREENNPADRVSTFSFRVCARR